MSDFDNLRAILNFAQRINPSSNYSNLIDLVVPTDPVQRSTGTTRKRQSSTALFPAECEFEVPYIPAASRPISVVLPTVSQLQLPTVSQPQLTTVNRLQQPTVGHSHIPTVSQLPKTTKVPFGFAHPIVVQAGQSSTATVTQSGLQASLSNQNQSLSQRTQGSSTRQPVPVFFQQNRTTPIQKSFEVISVPSPNTTSLRVPSTNPTSLGVSSTNPSSSSVSSPNPSSLRVTSPSSQSLRLPSPIFSIPNNKTYSNPEMTTNILINAHDDEEMDAELSLQPGESDGVRHFCVVCGDESDGLHFGQYTCRACAAFFRRTVSLRLEYACKHNNMCDIEKNARNMCRSCRFHKCLNKGMQTSAVQHARDGIGKRREPQKRPKESSFTDSGISQTSQLSGQTIVDNSPTTSSLNGSLSFASTPTSTDGGKYTLSTYQTNNSVTGLANALYQYNQDNTSYASPPDQRTVLQLGQTINVDNNPVPYVMNSLANVNLQQLTQVAFAQQQQQQHQQQPPPRESDMKLLNRMIEGYQHFRSLRKASYTLIDDTPRLQKNGDLSQSNYDTSKKHCKIEASLLMDTVDKFYHPFESLKQDDRNGLFDQFFCMFTNAERAFRSYKLFPVGDDRLIMPDGGTIKLQELTRFYENSSSIRGDPSQLAGIFENAMSYVVNVIINKMRNLNMTETELIALSGIMLWKDTVKDLSPQAIAIVHSSREQIMRDLHLYYRSNGVYDCDITIKVANLLLLLPEMEHVTRLMRENYHLAAVFNIIDPPMCGKTKCSE
ncbi:unnamed protein product [Bursaphelenchus okinawaensis]|uniref:Uncharacterized protein n=1 Tax=Bursaphelenchus okinawaensis TaxID=465554 RepID=A0A811LK58_9BILA|nr:unnamed protein product [Bursaphelenchus okinawaensis]CAG9124026.1 unnamed protein product [Bursaphelenchus okinawaensis]